MMLRYIHWGIAYLTAILSALLAARYGFKSADTTIDAALRGGALLLIALIAAHGMAWATKAWRKGLRLAGAGIAVGGLVCFMVTLAGGIGTIADSGSAVRAERSAVESSNKAAQRAETEAGATLAAAIESTRRECEGGRGKRCREADAAMKEAQGRADAARAAIRTLPSAPQPDPQAAALARLLQIDERLAGTLYAFAVSLAMEIGAMLAMLNAEINGVEPKRKEPDTGPLAEFLADNLSGESGHSVDIDALQSRYKSWCRERGFFPLIGSRFADELASICKRVGIGLEIRKGRAFCLNMRMKA